MTEALVELWRRPVLWELEDGEEEIAISAPRRRAVPRLGRNDPCHCGSGKKYKKCCAEKDEVRLRDSSDVAGLTRTELRRNLEEHLPLERVQALRRYELAALDPKLVPHELLPVILNRLLRANEFEAIREIFAAVGVEGWEGEWLDAIDFALGAGKKDEARALMALGNGKKEEWLGFPARFLAEGIDRPRALEILEDEAKQFEDDGGVTLAVTVTY